MIGNIHVENKKNIVYGSELFNSEVNRITDIKYTHPKPLDLRILIINNINLFKEWVDSI